MDVHDILQPNILGSTPHYGTIATDAVDFTTLIQFILPDFDDEQRWGPCRWMPRDSVSLPQRGDKCLVVFDNQMNPWILAWWPF